jgi:hypothetical protein
LLLKFSQFLNNVIINRTKVFLPQAYLTLDDFGYPVYALWFYGVHNFKLFGFSIFRFWAYLMKVILSVLDEGYFERTWWRLFWAYFMKVILSVLDEGYFERTWWRLFWAYLMKVILSVLDEGYSRNALCALNLMSTFY